MHHHTAVTINKKETVMHRHTVVSITSLFVLAVGLAMSAAAAPAQYFSDPTRINILDRWNADGTWAHSQTSDSLSGNAANLLQLWQGDWRIWLDGDDTYPTTRDTWLQIDFAEGTPAVGAVKYSYLNADHGTDNFTVSDQNGTYITEASSGITTGTNANGQTRLTSVDTTVSARIGNDYLRYGSTVSKELVVDTVFQGGTTYHHHAIRGLTAFAAAAESVLMYPTDNWTYVSGYNIFYDADISSYAINNATYHSNITSTMASTWLDGNLSTQIKPPAVSAGTEETEWIIIPFEDTHYFIGARLPLYDGTRNFEQLKIEVAETDGGPWTQVFYTDVWQSTSSNLAWADFGTGAGSAESAIGKYVRLSWWSKVAGAPGADQAVELRDIQLFTQAIPEPGTFALLSVLGLLGFRRSRRS